LRFVIIILGLVLVAVLLSISDEKLSKRDKIFILVGGFLIFGFAYFYEEGFKKHSLEVKEITDGFLQGKTLNCKGVDVNSSNFDFSDATDSFTAKRDAPSEFRNQIFKAIDCQIKK